MAPLEDFKQKLLQDLNLAYLPPQEQEEALAVLEERLQKVMLYTLLERLSGEQKERFAERLTRSESLEHSVAEIASEVPGLSAAVEASLLSEYEALKKAMQK